MAPRPASFSSSSSSIWISDALLANAFARVFGSCRHGHCSTMRRPRSDRHPPARRFVSNVPGPLESRRRLGKRQMTELQPTACPSFTMPIWALSNMSTSDWRYTPGMREWQWSPPRKGPDDRQNWSLSKWLDLDLEAPEEPDDLDPASSETYSATAREFFAQLHTWRDSGTAEDENTGSDNARFETICSAFEAQLRLAALSPEEILEAFDCIWDNRPKQQPEIALTLYTAALEGIRSCQLLQSRDLGPDLWQHLLELGLGQDPHISGRLLTETLLTAPSTALAQLGKGLAPSVIAVVIYGPGFDMVDSEQLSVAFQEVSAAMGDFQRAIRNLQNLFFTSDNPQVLWAAFDAAENIHWACCRAVFKVENLLSTEVAFATKMAIALQEVDKKVLRAITKEVLPDMHARPRWLFVLARMPTVRQARLFSALERIPVTFDFGFICEILLAQWKSRSYVDEDVHLAFWIMTNTMETKNQQVMLAALALAIFYSPRYQKNCTALYISLANCLRILGRNPSAELVWSVRAMCTSLSAPLPSDFLESLAWATDDVHAAINLYAIHRRTVRGGEVEWPIAFWNKFIDRLIQELSSGGLTPGRVGYVLGLSMDQRFEKRSVNMETLSPAVISLVHQLAAYYTLSNLPQRLALRGVENCRLFLHRYNVANTPDSTASMLRAIFHLVTRDLAAGRPGRTSRLCWYLDLVEKAHGLPARVASGHALERWRMAAAKDRDRRRLERWSTGAEEGEEWN